MMSFFYRHIGLFCGILIGIFLSIIFFNLFQKDLYKNTIYVNTAQACFFSLTKNTSISDKDKNSFCLDYAKKMADVYNGLE